MLDYNISVMDCWRVDLLQLSDYVEILELADTQRCTLYGSSVYSTRLGLGDFAIRIKLFILY